MPKGATTGDGTSGGELRVMDDGVDLRRDGPGQMVREKRLSKTEGIGRVSGSGAHRRRRNRLDEPADVLRFGEKFGQPGGMIWRGKKGEEERRGRPSYRRGFASKRQGINRD
jgi:hypothetical protein